MSFDNELWKNNREIAEKYGVVYTPKEIADFMVQSALDILAVEFPNEIPNFYEPFGGGGVIVSSMLEKEVNNKISVFEIMPEAVENMQAMNFPDNVEIINSDTFKTELDKEQLNVIITNPPYGL